MDTPAGWYPDTERAQTQRYWDGEAWSDHRAPQPQRSGPGVYVWVVAAGILLAVVVVFAAYWVAHANDGLRCETKNAQRAIDGQPALVCPE